MKKLIEGIHQFQQKIFNPQRDKYEKMVEAQHPEALFITCSDSRVIPNLITQSDPGDLFVIRNVGNIVPAYGVINSSESAAIEYAVGVLEVKNIIVCGHTHCGALTLLLDSEHETEHKKEYAVLRNWLGFAEAARRAVKKYYADLSLEEQLSVCAELSVLAQIENLRSHPSVMLALTSVQLQLHAWVYDMESGKMLAFDPTKGHFSVIENYEVLVTGEAQTSTGENPAQQRPRIWTRNRND